MGVDSVPKVQNEAATMPKPLLTPGVEKIVPPSRTSDGILLPEKTAKLNSGKVVAVGPGAGDRDGKLIPVNLKEGDTVLLPDYGGTQLKLAQDKEFHLFREDDILGTLHE